MLSLRQVAEAGITLTEQDLALMQGVTTSTTSEFVPEKMRTPTLRKNSRLHFEREEGLGGVMKSMRRKTNESYVEKAEGSQVAIPWLQPGMRAR
jgi:hypothetical protein